MDNTKPFNISYVMCATTRCIRDNIDFSIRKTSGRIAEFSDDLGKSQELLQTLSALYALRRVVDEFQENNLKMFSRDVY